MKESIANIAAAEPESSDSAAARARALRKRELIYGAFGFFTGFILLPVLIFMVGTTLLGAYAGGRSIGAFFADFYINLAHGTLRTWFIALAPYLAFWLVRLSFRRFPFGKSQSGSPQPEDLDTPEGLPQRPAPRSAQSKAPPSRREPFISP